MIRQKLAYIIIILLIGFGAFIMIKNLAFKVSEKGQLIESIEQTVERHQEKLDSETIKDDDPEAKAVEEPTVAEPIKEFISDVFHKAVDFFQHKEIHISAIGDSLTQGVGDETMEGGYVGVIQDKLQTELSQSTIIINNFGKRGNRTDQLFNRLMDETEEELQQSIESSDIILVTIGANDVMEVFKQNILDIKIEPFLEEQTYYEQRLQNILTTLIETNDKAKIYLLGIYNPFKQYFQDIKELELIVNDWNNISEKVADSFEQVSFIPIKDIFETSQEHLFADDNFHPNKSGYERMAERVLQYLTDSER